LIAYNTLMLAAAPPALLNPRAGSVAAWQSRAKALVLVAAAMPAIALLHLLDRAAFDEFFRPHFREPGFFLPDWYQLLRQAGNQTLWVIAAFMLWGVDAQRHPALTRPATHRGLMLLVATAGAGLIAELLKILVARERPMASGTLDYQGYVHHIPVLSPLWGVGNLGFPSSHAAVAFAGAFALGRLVPGTFPVMIFMALGCAWTRLLMGAHFLTDVAGGLAVAAAWVIWLRPETRWPRRRTLTGTRP
jgi:membrane-associated phospholipid phosphatase